MYVVLMYAKTQRGSFGSCVIGQYLCHSVGDTPSPWFVLALYIFPFVGNLRIFKNISQSEKF